MGEWTQRAAAGKDGTAEKASARGRETSSRARNAAAARRPFVAVMPRAGWSCGGGGGQQKNGAHVGRFLLFAFCRRVSFVLQQGQCPDVLS